MVVFIRFRVFSFFEILGLTYPFWIVTFLQILEPNKTDEFYHEAAKNGITIWQDFMFACSTYTNQTDFLDSVARINWAVNHQQSEQNNNEEL